MDDWALATVADMEDRTRVRGMNSIQQGANPRRRRRRSAGGDGGSYEAVGTIVRDTNPGAPRSTGTRPMKRARGTQALVWGLVASAVLVIVLGSTATLQFLRKNSDAIPVVTDISGELVGDTVEFSWSDPGLADTDSYQVMTSDGQSSIQRRPEFTGEATPGEPSCITVTVNREGRTGQASGEKCVDVPG
jgi:hypothetical protein